MLGSSYHDDTSAVKLLGLVDDTLMESSFKSVAVIGDTTTAVAKGDKVVIGSCHNLMVESVSYSQFDATQGAGFLFNTKYPLSQETSEARLKGYTTLQVTNTSPSFASFASDCGQNDDLSANIEVGSYVESKRALQGRVILIGEYYIVTSSHGSPYVEFSFGFASNISPGDVFTIGGVSYEVDLSNDDYGVNCIKFTTDFLRTVSSSDKKVKVYPKTGIEATTTVDLSSNLSESDYLYIGADKLRVESVTPSIIYLSGTVTCDNIGVPVYVNAYGVEHYIVMKAFTANLGTFRVVPEANWRGTASRIFSVRPNGELPMRYVIGNPSEIQVITLQDLTPNGGNCFSLTFDGFTTTLLAWPVGDGATAANAIKEALLSLHSVKGDIKITVSASNSVEVVFLVNFWGIYSQGTLPQIESSVTQGDDHATIHHDTLQNGVANGEFTSQYTALKEDSQYNIRVTAKNSEGFGSSSAPHQVSTAKVGVLPGAPQAVLLGTYYTSNELDLHYQPPDHDGGSAITKYKVEWDSSPSFSSSSTDYGSEEVALQPEVQEITLSCRSACFGTFKLLWGNKVSAPLGVEATASELEVEVSKLVGVYDMGEILIKVTKRAQGFGNSWRVTFSAVRGNIGELQVDGHFLYGGDPDIMVSEVILGVADIHPGAYTFEIQTVYIRKARGFNSPVTGSFTLSFEDKETSAIDVEASAEKMKSALEALKTVHTVNVQCYENYGSFSWVVTFTHLMHELKQGAGDIGLIHVASTSLSEPTVTSVRVFENIKGTNQFMYKLKGLTQGTT